MLLVFLLLEAPLVSQIVIALIWREIALSVWLTELILHAIFFITVPMLIVFLEPATLAHLVVRILAWASK